MVKQNKTKMKLFFGLWLITIMGIIPNIDLPEMKRPITVIDHKVMESIKQEIMINKALLFLACRESGFNYNAVSPTNDYGKYQINIANLRNYGIDPKKFLKDSVQQEKFAKEFMKVHFNIIKNPNSNAYWKHPVNYKVLINSWAGIGVVVNNPYSYNHIFLRRKGCECYE